MLAFGCRDLTPLALADVSSDASETGSCQSLVDAKRKFFSQPATPLRIDARRLFADGDAAAHSTTPSPQAGVPPSNRATGSTGVLLANLTLLAFVVNNTYIVHVVPESCSLKRCLNSFVTCMCEGRRKSSRPNHERGVLCKTLFAIFERIHLSTIHIKSSFF